MSVCLSFAPPTAGKFTTKLPFLINGLYMQSVTVSGEGCDLRLELADPNQVNVNLGAVPLNSSVTARSVPRQPLEAARRCLAARGG